MAEAHDYLRRVLSEEGEFDWHHVIAALHEVEAEDPPSEASVALMKDIAHFDGELRLGGESGTIRLVSETAGSEQLRAISDVHLEP